MDAVLGDPPPQLQLDEATLDDAKWFCKRWLIAHSTGKAHVAAPRACQGFSNTM